MAVNRYSLMAALLSATALTGFPQQAFATNFFWSSASGDWDTITNWSPNGTPTTSDNAFLGSGSAATVTITSDANAGGLAVGIDADATLSLTGATTTLTTTGDTLAASATGVTASIGISSGTWDATGTQLGIGVNGGTGTLGLDSGATLISQSAYVGSTGDGDGTVTLLSGSSWTNTNTYLGHNGTGTLTLSGASTLTDQYGYLGYYTTDIGTATVTGAGSSWDTTYSLYVGVGGTGNLTVSDGGSVSNTGVQIAADTGSTGSALVTGSGSSLSSTNTFYVGAAGTGDLTVSNGGSVTNATGLIGGAAGGTGTVTITDAGSSWTTTDQLYVGLSGTGNMEISNGGSVDSVSTVIGNEAGATGTVSVDGSGSSFSTANMLTIGSLGTGSLSLTGGATGSAGTTVFAYDSAATGDMTVSGEGTSFSSGSTIVGVSGGGALSVADGGAVTLTSLALGSAHGGLGTATVDGVSAGSVRSALNVSGDFLVGDVGSGAMTVSGGSSVTSGKVVLGNAYSGSGTATVTGTGSSWDVTGDLNVGRYGTGTFDIASAGAVSATGSILIASTSASTGSSVTVSGSGSTLSTASQFFVGSAGDGSLSISDGGVVTTGSAAHVTYNSGATALVSVDGAGSQWVIGGNFEAGDGGIATINVTGGGAISAVADTILGYYADAPGTDAASFTVTGAGSSYVTGGDLFVGYEGDATMRVADGGDAEIDGGITLGYFGNYTGALTVTGANTTLTYASGMVIGQDGIGVLTISDGAEIGTDTGPITIAQNAGSTGTLNIGAALGDAATAVGTLAGTAGLSISFGAGTGSIVFNHTDANYAFDATVSGYGLIRHVNGHTNFTGDASGFTGTTVVTGGTLSVNGTLAGQIVVLGGALGGSGSFGDISTYDGGTLAPGNSVGTMNVASANFASGSIYDVELNDGGFVAGTNNDLINAADMISIDSGASVHVTPENGTDNGSTYTPGSYTIATAAGGVSGTFDTVADDYLFLDFTLGYDASNIILTSEKVASFQTMALTPNQIAAAGAAEALGGGNAVYDAILGLSTEAEAQSTFDALSGEGYAAAQNVLATANGYNGQALLDHINKTFAALQQTGALGYAEDATGQSDPSAGTAWGVPYGRYWDASGDGNAAGFSTTSGGILFGGDIRSGTLLGGVFAGAGHTGISIPDRDTAIASTDLSLGVYGGAELDDTRLALILGYIHNLATSTRTVSAGTFSQMLTADYGADALSAFGEVSHSFDFGATSLEPFGALGLVHQMGTSFAETGGSAALSGAILPHTEATTELGLRAKAKMALGTTLATLSGGFGWKHTFASTPQTNNSFSGGTAFTVSGSETTADALTLDLGLDFDLSNAASLSFSYNGEISTTGQSHRGQAHLALAF